MSYPEPVWSRFVGPQYVLPPEQRGRALLLASADTPASHERAQLWLLDEQWCWRALGSPWLIAALEVVCATRAAEGSAAELELALQGLQLPPVKRYCAVMARELWQTATQESGRG